MDLHGKDTKTVLTYRFKLWIIQTVHSLELLNGNDLTDQITTIPEKAVEYSIPLHNVCSGSGYSVSISVNNEASVLSFITTLQTSSHCVIAIAPVVGDEGIYTVKVNYQNSNGVDQIKTFNLHIYPEYEIGQEVVDFEFSTNFCIEMKTVKQLTLALMITLTKITLLFVVVT